MKAISNICFSNNHFFSVLLDNNNRKDGYSTNKNREIKLGAVFSKNLFLIIWSHLSNLCFLRSEIDIGKDNYIEKIGDNIGTSIANINRNEGAKNLNTGTVDANKIEKFGISTTNIDRVKESSISKINNAAYMFLFSLLRALFFITCSSQLETISLFLIF